MSGSAVLSATIEAITNSTPKQATVSNHSLARDDKPARAKSPGTGWVIASTTHPPLQPSAGLRAQQPPRLTVSFLVRLRGDRVARPRTGLVDEQCHQVGARTGL